MPQVLLEASKDHSQIRWGRILKEEAFWATRWWQELGRRLTRFHTHAGTRNPPHLPSVILPVLTWATLLSLKQLNTEVPYSQYYSDPLPVQESLDISLKINKSSISLPCNKEVDEERQERGLAGRAPAPDTFSLVLPHGTISAETKGKAISNPPREGGLSSGRGRSLSIIQEV